MTRLRAIACAAVAAAVSCTDAIGPAPPEWATLAFGNDVIVWTTVDSGYGSGTGNPLVSGNSMYFAAAEGGTPMLVALDAASGVKRWEAATGFFLEIVEAGPDVMTVGYGARLFSQSGALLRTLGHVNHFSNAVTDGARVILGTRITGVVDALDPATGAVIWSAKVGGDNDRTRIRTLSATSDRVFAIAQYQRPLGASLDSVILAAIDRSTGAIQWRKVVGTFDSFARPALLGDKVYIAMADNEFIALSQATGDEAWRWKAPGIGSSNLGALTACNGRVLASHPVGIVALDANTGAIVWNNTAVGSGSWYTLQCAENRVVAGGHAIAVLDEATGATLVEYPTNWQFAPEDFFVTGVTLHQGFLYVATYLGAAKLKAP